MNSSAPDVSIILPILNETEGNLRLSLESLTNQSFANFEIIVVDDSTFKNTRSALARFAKQDNRVRIFRSPNKEGLAAALNFGIAQSKGRYLARADSDDIQESDRLQKQVQFLDANPEVGVVGAAIKKIDGHNNICGQRKYPTSHADISRVSCIKNPLCHPTVTLRREILDLWGGYDPSFKRAEDYELWLRLIRHGVRFANLEEPLVRYRLSDSIKRDRDNWKFNLMAKLRHFSFDHLLSRLVGISLVSVCYLMPNALREQIYQIYNRA